MRGWSVVVVVVVVVAAAAAPAAAEHLVLQCPTQPTTWPGGTSGLEENLTQILDASGTSWSRLG